MFSADTIYVSGMPPCLWGWNGRFTKVKDGLYVKEQHPLWGFLPLQIIRTYISRSDNGKRWNFYVDYVSSHNKVFRGPEEESPIGYWSNMFKVDTAYSPEMPLYTFAKIGLICSLITFACVSGYAGYIVDKATNLALNVVYSTVAYSKELAIVCGGYLIGMGTISKLSQSSVTRLIYV